MAGSTPKIHEIRAQHPNIGDNGPLWHGLCSTVPRLDHAYSVWVVQRIYSSPAIGPHQQRRVRPYAHSAARPGCGCALR